MYDIGNVTEDSDFLFSYSATEKLLADLTKAQQAQLPSDAKEKEKAVVPSFEQSKPAAAAPGQTNTHMQVQCRIEHTYPSGMRCLRVLTSRLPVTLDRDAVEAVMRSSLVAEFAVRESAALAQRGMCFLFDSRP